MLKLVQLALWVEGQSVHDDEHSLCCPDASCCQSHLQASREERWAFSVAHVNEDYEICKKLMAAFMQRALEDRKARRQQEEWQSPTE